MGLRDINSGVKLFGVKDLTPDELRIYNEIIEEGGETTPKHVHMHYPDKDKARKKFGWQRRKKVTRVKPKRKKGCGCK
jgi:hypothetical protein